MKIELLLKQLEELNLPKDQYIIIASASMAIRHIREADDLDLLVTKGLWQELTKKYPVETLDGLNSIAIGNVQILREGSMFLRPEIAPEELVFQTAETIQGYPFISLDLLKKFKLNLAREKDLRDVGLIDKYLSSSK